MLDAYVNDPAMPYVTSLTILLAATMFPAHALPPRHAVAYAACEDRLVLTEARPALARVRARGISDDCTFVGNLVTEWRDADGRIQSWGVYDCHNQRKTFPERTHYAHPLKSGDVVFLFNREWRPTVSGVLELAEGSVTYPSGAGPSTLTRQPFLRNHPGEPARRTAIARDWIGATRAIVLARMSDADRALWRDRDEPNMRRWVDYEAAPVIVRGQNFRYDAAHFERVIEAPFTWSIAEDRLRIELEHADGKFVPERGDLLLFFDRHDDLKLRHKNYERDGLTILGEMDLPDLASFLGDVHRIVLIKHQLGLGRAF